MTCSCRIAAGSGPDRFETARSGTSSSRGANGMHPKTADLTIVASADTRVCLPCDLCDTSLHAGQICPSRDAKNNGDAGESY